MSETRGNAERVTTASVGNNPKKPSYLPLKFAKRYPASGSASISFGRAMRDPSIPGPQVEASGLMIDGSEISRQQSIASSPESSEGGEEESDYLNLGYMLSDAYDTVQSFDN